MSDLDTTHKSTKGKPRTSHAVADARNKAIDKIKAKLQKQLEGKIAIYMETRKTDRDALAEMHKEQKKAEFAAFDKETEQEIDRISGEVADSYGGGE